MMMRALLFVLLASLTGCQLFPLQVMKDDFDGATIVRQPNLVASRPTLTTEDNPQGLGFEWSTAKPDIVLLTAGLFEISNIEKLEFIADDQPITGVALASVITEFNTSKYSSAPASMRLFSIPMAEFRKLANARIVKMKISGIGNYSVSRFGQDYPDVMVSSRFAPFLAKIDAVKKQ